MSCDKLVFFNRTNIWWNFQYYCGQRNLNFIFTFISVSVCVWIYFFFFFSLRKNIYWYVRKDFCCSKVVKLKFRNILRNPNDFCIQIRRVFESKFDWKTYSNLYCIHLMILEFVALSSRCRIFFFF